MENIKKGKDYEIFINNHINTLKNTKISYLWKDVPEYVLFDYGFIKSYDDNRLQRKTQSINPLEDIGTDIIYIDKKDNCIIVQCKNYTNNIKIEDLSGFFFIMRKHKDKLGKVYYTNNLSKKILTEYNDDETIKFIRKEFKQEPKLETKITPYKYQQNVLTLAEKYYKSNNSGIISMPCGTGKTLISCYIGMKYKTVIFITPLKQYAKQNIDRYHIYEPSRESIMVNSDGIRNVPILKHFIKKNDKKLLSVTYDSCDIINKIIGDLDDVLVIFDEFHNFSYNNIYDETNDIYKLINNYDNVKKLYLSATPRIYELENNNDVCADEMFGGYIYTMSFNHAIEQKYIADYKIYLPIFANEQNNEINKLNINKDYLLKLQFLIEAIKVCGTLKMIVYVKNHEEINTFIENFNKLNKYYCYDVMIDKITCDDTFKERNRKLTEFNNSSKIAIMLSVYILDEAIDIPNCDSIYMTYTSSSKVKNIQRLSRALRYKKNKLASIFLFCTNIDESLDYISSIREYDTDFVKKINYIEVSNGIKKKEIREKINDDIKETNKIKVLGIKLYRSEKWDVMLQKLKTYIDENNKRPHNKVQNKDIKTLGHWLSDQLKNYKKHRHIMENKEIRKIWEKFIDDYRVYFINNNDKWLNALQQAKNYIDKYNRKPSYKDKNKDIKTLGKWISEQPTMYKKRVKIMKNEEIRKIWEDFTNAYQKYFISNKDKWFETLQQVKAYIDKYKKTPYESSKNKDIGKLGKWITAQKLNYKRNIESMKNEEIRQKWEEFINDYKIHFINNDDKWNSTLQQVIEYINKHERQPSAQHKNNDVRKLKNWINTQKTNYKNKQCIMCNDKYRKKWEQFLNDYKKYFTCDHSMSNEDKWNYTLQKVKEYINQYKKRPSASDKDDEIRKLGNWICWYSKNYPDKIGIMGDAEICQKWEEFINEYKTYFISNDDKWDNTLQQVIEYIDKYKCRPSTTHKNVDIKVLGLWISAQIQQYNNKRYILCRDEYRKKWEEFTNKYKKYF